MNHTLYICHESCHHFDVFAGPVLSAFTPPVVAPVSPRNTQLQIIVKVGETILTPENPEFGGEAFTV